VQVAPAVETPNLSVDPASVVIVTDVEGLVEVADQEPEEV
jgi:hypothetical protein